MKLNEQKRSMKRSNLMELNEAQQILTKAGYICERVANGSMPKYFYHGTPKKNLESIRKNGLLAEVEGRNYLISYDCVCLTLDAESAIEWAQRAKFNNFAVLRIDSSKLNPNLLELDPNMQTYDDDYLPIDSRICRYAFRAWN